MQFFINREFLLHLCLAHTVCIYFVYLAADDFYLLVNVFSPLRTNNRTNALTTIYWTLFSNNVLMSNYGNIFLSPRWSQGSKFLKLIVPATHSVRPAQGALCLHTRITERAGPGRWVFRSHQRKHNLNYLN